jgi:hypothetical protein
MELLKKHYDNNEINTAFFLSKILKDKLKNNSEYNKLTFEIISKLDKNIFKQKYIKVLLACSWCSSKELCDTWNKMSKGNYIWNNIQIVSEEPCDYYCIINQPPSNLKIILENTIVFNMEPHMDKKSHLWNEEWMNIDKNKFKWYGSHDKHYNNNEWHISKTYNELKNEEIIKDENLSNILSTVLSDKYNDPGHIKRVDFIKFLQLKNDIKVDVFGGNRFMWDNYKGSLPYHEKDNALLPYKYIFNVENFQINNYYTEKLIDGILSECLVFYHGCPNIKELIDEKAFIWLELSNFEEDYKLIKKAIEEDWWKERLSYIKQAKTKILDELQFFPRLEKIIN